VASITFDTNSFDDSFDDLYRIAYRVAYRILGDRSESEDVAQDTLSKAYARWWRLKGDAERWVSRVSANRAIDVWRRRRHQDLDAEVLDRAGRGEPVLERLALADALSRLSRRQREVVVLRYLAGYPEADVAEILDCSVGSVKTHASRALTNLRTSLS